MNARNPRIWILFLACLVILSTGSPRPAGAEDFPLRPYYPEVPFIDTNDLLDIYDSTTIVDIRSRFEYDVAKINKAELLPLTEKDFADKLEQVRGKASLTPMVFYCNGHTCAKSYQAAQLALSLGFSNVYAYDGGIFDWINAAPDMATLMGETPARSEQIISGDEFKEYQLDFAEFAEAAAKPDTIVIDIRDPFQRQLAPRIEGVRNIPLDPLLDLVVSRIWTEKKLLFFDAVGKQVRWLQYFLKSYGYFDYAFLRGGVDSISDDPEKIRPVVDNDKSVISSQAMLLKITGDDRLDNTDRKVVSYLLANIKFNNYVVVDMKTLGLEPGIRSKMLLASVEKLSKLRYATHSTMQDTLIVQVDPRLAWKGDAESKLWKEKVDEFKALVGE